MAKLSSAERSTMEAVVDGVQRRARKRRQAGRSGWALLITGGLSLPIIGAALNNTIGPATAVLRIGIALVITSFVASMVGSIIDNYQAQAALASVEKAVLTARATAEKAALAAPDHQADDSNKEALTNEFSNDN